MMNDNGERQFLELQVSSISFHKQEYTVATFNDVTESKKTTRAEANTRMVNLLSSNLTHEMITPLECIIRFAQSLERELKHSEKRREAELIMVTARLILSQVKILLDRNMIANNMFTLQNEDVPINRIVADAVSIMHHLAAVKDIKINFHSLAVEVIVRVDPIRLQ